MKKLLTTLSFIFFFLPKLTFGQSQGCLSNTDNYIYFVLDAEGDYRNGYIQYELNNSSERFLASSQCYTVTGAYPSCYIDINSGGGGSRSGYGRLVNYGPMNCDLDGDTWALLTFSIIPIFIFRKKIFTSLEKRK